MKKLLYIFTYILLLSLCFQAGAINITDKSTVETNILSIKNGDKYKTKIENMVKKLNTDITKLELVLSSLKNIDNKVTKLKEWKNKITLVAILDYFIYAVQTEINNINTQGLIEKIEEEKIDTVDEINKEIIYTKDELYEWFTSNYNDNEKTILAWVETFVYNASVVAGIEEIEAKEVIFTLESTDLSNLKSVIQEAGLYVEGKKIETINTGDIKIISPTQAELRFRNLNGFFIPKQQIEFRLSITPQNIWFEKVWVFQALINITKVEFSETEGLVSQKPVNSIVFNDNDGIETFQISPVLFSASVVDSLKDGLYAKLNLQIDNWRNTQQSKNSEVRAELDRLDFYLSESNGAATYEIVNSDDSSQRVTGTKSGNVLSFDMTTLSDNNISKWKWENFHIYITDNTDVTVFLELSREWIIYSVPWITWVTNINAYLEKNIELGSRTY